MKKKITAIAMVAALLGTSGILMAAGNDPVTKTVYQPAATPSPLVSPKGLAEQLAANIQNDAPKTTAKTIAFLDVNSHWAKDAISQAVQKGYVDGYEDNTFKPDMAVSRAEFLKMAISALGLKVDAAKTGDIWYTPYVNAAVTAHIHAWSDFTSGDWNTPITRLEMSRIAVRAANNAYQQQASDIPDNLVMYLATKAGLIQGLDATGTLGETESTTRGQSVTIIERILTKAAGGSLPMDKHAVSRGEVKYHGTNVFTMLPRYFAAKDFNKFDLSQFKWDSADGVYHDHITAYIAVDTGDENDPFRNEIEGIPFPMPKDDRVVSYYSPVGNNSIVTFSKSNVTITGKYASNIYSFKGGSLKMADIGPKEGIDNPEILRGLRVKNSPDEVLTSLSASDQPQNDWNVDKTGFPYNPNLIPADGGSFTWIEAQVHPKGDNYVWTGDRILLDYSPSIQYFHKIGPKFEGGRDTITQRFSTDYTISNR